MTRAIYHIAMGVAAICSSYAEAHDQKSHADGVAVYAQANDRKFQSKTIAFVHAAVVPMDRERVLRDQTVVVIDGRIAALGPASKVKVPAKAVRIDARGRYLLPALSDMHVHVEGESWNALLSPEALAASKTVPFEDFLFP